VVAVGTPGDEVADGPGSGAMQPRASLDVDASGRVRRVPDHGAVEPHLVGILNVIADSFSDPRARALEQEDAVRAGIALRDAGACLVDVGAESASPATPVVEPAVEIDRLVPVVAALRRAGVPTSVDTYKLDVAAACLDAGAAVINDYSGRAHRRLAGPCADAGASLVITHHPGGPKSKLLDPARYTDVVGDLLSWFEEQVAAVECAGLPREQVVLDPGSDLSKTPAQSVAVLRGLPRLAALGLPILLAVSRKDVIGAISPSAPAERGPGTLAAVGHAVGVPRCVVRVHDVAAARQFLQVAAVPAGRTHVDPELALPHRNRRQGAPG
jgi:dihydropteroate synthase